MRSNTSAFLCALREEINQILPTTYEEAPTQGAIFPYAVIGGVSIIDLESGDQLLFDVDLWADEREPEATVQLERFCDEIRNALNGLELCERDVFYAHIGFENQNAVSENEFDLAHRRLSFAARVFYR